MAKIPLMVPVSYPKRIPPRDTKAPIRMAGRAEPGTPSGLFNSFMLEKTISVGPYEGRRLWQERLSMSCLGVERRSIYALESKNTVRPPSNL